MILKGRNFKSNGVVPPDPETDTITIQVAFTSIESPSSKLAPMKYNKKTGILLVKDDGQIDDYTVVYPYIKGNLPVESSVPTAGLKYTDGCGNPVGFHYTFAVNTAKPKDGTFPNETTWDMYDEILLEGHGMANHSRDHFGYDKYFEVKDNEKNIFNNLGWRTRAYVIPNADEGYSATAPNLGYIGVGSTFGGQSADDAGGKVKYTGINVNAIDEPTLEQFLFFREYTNTWDSGSMDIIKGRIDEAFTKSSGNVNWMAHMFSHEVFGSDGTINAFINLMEYIKNHPQNSDSLWVPNMQEFLEYCEAKLLIEKSETIVGNNMTIQLDLSSLPKEGLYQDMSLVVTGGEISSISVTGSDRFTINKATGLINIFRKNKNVKDPESDLPPPQIISAQRSGNQVLLTYNKPIVQTQFSNVNGNAYEVSGVTILSVTGEGVEWSINCSANVPSGSFSYRMQRGNAMDQNSNKVNTYINFPIS